MLMDFRRYVLLLIDSGELYVDLILCRSLYEPLWEDLFHRLKAKNIHVNSIWIADVAQQGQSGVINEKDLGNDRETML